MFQPGAHYRCEFPLVVNGRIGILFAGPGVQFIQTVTAPYSGANAPDLNGHRSAWLIKFSQHLAFRDVTMIGANANAGTSLAAYNALYEHQHAFDIESVDDIEISGVTCDKQYGDYAYIAYVVGTPGGATKNIYIHDSTFLRNGRQSFSIVIGTDIRIEDNLIQNARFAHLDFEPNATTSAIRRVSFSRNECHFARAEFLNMGGAGSAMSDVTIADNQLIGCPLNSLITGPVGANQRQRLNFEGNKSDTKYGTPNGYLITVHNWIDPVFAGNVGPLQAGRTPKMQGIQFQNCVRPVDDGTNVFALV